MILTQLVYFLFCSDILQVQLHMDSILLVPLLTPCTRYSEWKLKMIASLKRQGLYEVSIGIGKESYEYDNDQLNDGDRAYGAICGIFSPSLLIEIIEFAEYPKDLQIELDRIFGKLNKEFYRNLESTFRNTRFTYSKVPAFTLSDEVV